MNIAMNHKSAEWILFLMSLGNKVVKIEILRRIMGDRWDRRIGS